MRSRKRLRALVLVMTTMGAVLGTTPSHGAPTTIAEGTVALLKGPGGPDHETVQYYAEGCRGDHPSAVFNAFIDVRGYEGATLRFVPATHDAAGPPVWRIIPATSCNLTSIQGPLITTSSEIEWTSTGPFVSISFTQFTVNARYILQVV